MERTNELENTSQKHTRKKNKTTTTEGLLSPKNTHKKKSFCPSIQTSCRIPGMVVEVMAPYLASPRTGAAPHPAIVRHRLRRSRILEAKLNRLFVTKKIRPNEPHLALVIHKLGGEFLEIAGELVERETSRRQPSQTEPRPGGFLGSFRFPCGFGAKKTRGLPPGLWANSSGYTFVGSNHSPFVLKKKASRHFCHLFRSPGRLENKQSPELLFNPLSGIQKQQKKEPNMHKKVIPPYPPH